MALLVGLFEFTLGSIGVILLTLLICYTLWIDQGNDYIMPSISDTWALPPATYISRLFATSFAFLFLIVAVAIYCRCRPISSGYQRTAANVSIILLVIGCFFFSWVPSVCNNPGPDCRGDPLIHDTVAVIFFACVNISVILIYLYFYFPSSWLEGMLVAGLVAATTICKVRYLPYIHIPALVDTRYAAGPLYIEPVFGLVEWTDVLIMLSLVLIYVRKFHQGYSVGFGDVRKMGEPVHVCYGFHTCTMAFIAAALLLAEAAASFPINLSRDHYNFTQGVPSISDLQVYPPSNWTTHWTFMIGCVMLSVVHVAIYWAQEEKSDRAASSTITTLALVSFVGLATAGSFGPQELHPVHHFGFGLFYVLYNVYMCYVTALSVLAGRAGNTGLKCMSMLALLLCTVSKVRMAAVSVSTLWFAWYPVLGWIDFTSTMLFIISYVQLVQSHTDGGLDYVRLCVVYDPATVGNSKK